MADNGFSDKIKGAISKGKGELKDQAGNATGDRQQQAEGKMDKAKGEIQDSVGDFKNNSKDR